MWEHYLKHTMHIYQHDAIFNCTIIYWSTLKNRVCGVCADAQYNIIHNTQYIDEQYYNKYLNYRENNKSNVHVMK